jgi:hypothetical protein
VLQAIEVLKKFVYKCEPNLPVEIFKVLLYSSFENGTEKMIKQFEPCVDEFKLPPNITIQIMTLNSLGRGDRSVSLKTQQYEAPYNLSYFTKTFFSNDF